MVHNGHKKILIIDDDPDILEGLQIILQEAGYIVEASEKYKDYLKNATTLPALIILDMLLSGEDGRDIARSLKSQKDTKKIPIIMISAHYQAGKTSFEAGVDDFIPKPFNIDDLLAKVEKHIAAFPYKN